MLQSLSSSHQPRPSPTRSSASSDGAPCFSKNVGVSDSLAVVVPSRAGGPGIACGCAESDACSGTAVSFRSTAACNNPQTLAFVASTPTPQTAPAAPAMEAAVTALLDLLDASGASSERISSAAHWIRVLRQGSTAAQPDAAAVSDRAARRLLAHLHVRYDPAAIRVE